MGTITMSEKEILRLEVFNKLSVRRLSQAKAANLLSISKRQVKRLYKRYKSQGAKGLISRKIFEKRVIIGFLRILGSRQ